MSGFSFRNLDFFRRVKRELLPEITETSGLGAAVSIFTFFLLGFLLYNEFNSFLTVTAESRLTLDRYHSGDDDTLSTSFAIIFPKLKCEYLTITATNFMGSHAAGMSTAVTKVHLKADGTPLRVHKPKTGLVFDASAGEEEKEEKEEKEKDENAEAVDEEEPKPVEGPVIAKSLTTETFKDELVVKGVTFVAFCVNQFIWCDKLEPIWERTAEELAGNQGIENKYALTRVNCSDASASDVCKQEKIEVYPTIRVYRKLPDTGTLDKTDFETYHGERSVEALSLWAKKVVDGADQVLNTKNPGQASMLRLVADKDGALDSHHGVGCRASGVLKVQKAPGMILFQARSPGQAFDWTMLDMSHSVQSLTFGDAKTHQKTHNTPEFLTQAMDDLHGKEFKSEEDIPTTHEHMCKVIRHRVLFGAPRWALKAQEEQPGMEMFGYVTHSNNLAKRGDRLPEVRINYDIVPFTVELSQKQKHLYHFLTEACAIIGGVFVVAGMLGRVMEKILAPFMNGGTSTNMPY